MDMQRISQNPFSNLLKNRLIREPSKLALSSFLSSSFIKHSLRLGNFRQGSRSNDKKNSSIVGSRVSAKKDYTDNKTPEVKDIPDIQFNEKSQEEVVIEEHNKQIAIKKEKDQQTVNDLVRKSNRVVISLSTNRFPWDFSPSSIIVEESRVTFVLRQFLSSQSHAVDIKDISNVFIESSIFTSSLQIVSRTFIQNDIKLDNLNRKKAEKARRIIEGLRTFAQNNIDTSSYEINELIEKLEELHKTQ
jgi:hypothetical protein